MLELFLLLHETKLHIVSKLLFLISLFWNTKQKDAIPPQTASGGIDQSGFAEFVLQKKCDFN